MAPLSKNVKIILVVLALLVLGYFVYSYLNKAPTSDVVTAQGGLSTQNVQNTSQVGRKLITTLDTIRSIKLDRSILESSAFMSLEDFSTEISPLPTGRDNPFAPVRPVAPPPAASASSRR